MANSPAPGGPPRKPLDKHVVWAILLVIGFIIASGIFMIWFGLRILSHSVRVRVAETNQDRKVVTVKTPLGNMQIAKDQNASELGLGLPIYPGASRAAGSSDDNSVSVTFNLPNETNLRIAAAKFNTPDPVSKVETFYKQQLGNETTSFTQTDNEGKIVFEIESGEQHKIVSLKPYDGGTRIGLVRIFRGEAEPN